jgi:hypothetical protein
MTVTVIAAEIHFGVVVILNARKPPARGREKVDDIMRSLLSCLGYVSLKQ